MIPQGTVSTGQEDGFPRVSGDDPKNADGDWDTFVFSPRERG